MGYVLFAVAALPTLVTTRLGIGLSAFGLLTSAPLGAFVLVQPLTSWLCDRYPTTRVLLWLSAIHVAVSVALDVPDTFEVLLGLRFTWGLIAGLVLSVGATHIARLSGGTTGTLEQGVYGGMITLGGALAFLFGGSIVSTTGGFGLHAVGIIPGVFALAGCLIHRKDRRTASIAADAPGGPVRSAPADGPSSRSPHWFPSIPLTPATLGTVTNPTVLLSAMFYVAIIGSYITMSTFVTSFFDEVGVVGPLNAIVLLVASGARATGGVIVWRFGVPDANVMGWSALVASGGFAVLAIGPAASLLVGLSFVVMLAVSVPFGAVFNVTARATDMEGSALATVVATGNVAALVLPPVAGALRSATGTYGGPFLLLAVLNAIALVSAVVLAGDGQAGIGRQKS